MTDNDMRNRRNLHKSGNIGTGSSPPSVLSIFSAVRSNDEED
jgi:hypothetical protein